MGADSSPNGCSSTRPLTQEPPAMSMCVAQCQASHHGPEVCQFARSAAVTQLATQCSTDIFLYRRHVGAKVPLAIRRRPSRFLRHRPEHRRLNTHKFTLIVIIGCVVVNHRTISATVTPSGHKAAQHFQRGRHRQQHAGLRQQRRGQHIYYITTPMGRRKVVNIAAHTAES